MQDFIAEFQFYVFYQVFRTSWQVFANKLDEITDLVFFILQIFLPCSHF